MTPVMLLPAVLLGFLGGAALVSPSRRGLSMAKRPSPLPGVPLVRWEHFVAVMACRPKGWRGPKGRLGTFDMDARRLKDVGLMTKTKKGVVDGAVGVWIGEWTPPLTEKKFLGSMPLQYASFIRSMRDMAPKVSGFVGVEVDEVECSLSGLLGVGHMAGEAGVESWVSDAAVRKRFPGTTESFMKTNMIF